MTTPTSSADSPWPFHGYAPGNYTCKCVSCDEYFQVDKRCIKCATCAIKFAVEFATLVPADPRPSSDTIGGGELAGAPTHRHVKTGHLVREIGIGFAQVSSHPIKEMSPVMIYEHGGKLWVRNMFEFDDGRFEELPALAASPHVEAPQYTGVLAGDAITEAMQICVDLLLLAELIGDKRFGAIVTEGAVQQLERADAFLQRLIKAGQDGGVVVKALTAERDAAILANAELALISFEYQKTMIAAVAESGQLAADLATALAASPHVDAPQYTGEPMAYLVVTNNTAWAFHRTREEAEHGAKNRLTYVKGCTSAEIIPLYAAKADNEAARDNECGEAGE